MFDHDFPQRERFHLSPSLSKKSKLGHIIPIKKWKYLEINESSLADNTIFSSCHENGIMDQIFSKLFEVN